MRKILFSLAMALSIQAIAAPVQKETMTIECKIVLDRDEYLTAEQGNYVKLSVMNDILHHISESDFHSPQAWHIEYHAIAWVQCNRCNIYYNAFEGGCKNLNCPSKMN